MSVADLRKRLAALVEEKISALEGSDEVNPRELQTLASTLRALGEIETQEDPEALEVFEQAQRTWEVPEDLKAPVEHAEVSEPPKTAYVPIKPRALKGILRKARSERQFKEIRWRYESRCPGFDWDKVHWDPKTGKVAFEK